MPTPTVLRGAMAIAAHLGTSAAAVAHLHRQRLIPTWQIGGTPYATQAALDDWQALSLAGKLPTS